MAGRGATKELPCKRVGTRPSAYCGSRWSPRSRFRPPCFCWGGWVTYNNAFAHADEELRARLDVLSEQANTVFESVALNFTSVDTIVGGMTDEQIQASDAEPARQTA